MNKPVKITKHMKEHTFARLIEWLSDYVTDYNLYLDRPIDKISQREWESVRFLNQVTVSYANKILEVLKGATK